MWYDFCSCAYLGTLAIVGLFRQMAEWPVLLGDMMPCQS
jgi:hypothetical protein